MFKFMHYVHSYAGRLLTSVERKNVFKNRMEAVALWTYERKCQLMRYYTYTNIHLPIIMLTYYLDHTSAEAEGLIGLLESRLEGDDARGLSAKSGSTAFNSGNGCGSGRSVTRGHSE